MTGWKAKISEIKRDVRALSFALGDARTPWHAKVLAACIVAYAVSPIDLIPDPIPVLGYLDDVILLPVGIWLVVRWIPPQVLAECRRRAEDEPLRHPRLRWVGGLVVLVLWVGLIWLAIHYGRKWFA